MTSHSIFDNRKPKLMIAEPPPRRANEVEIFTTIALTVAISGWVGIGFFVPESFPKEGLLDGVDPDAADSFNREIRDSVRRVFFGIAAAAIFLAGTITYKARRHSSVGAFPGILFVFYTCLAIFALMWTVDPFRMWTGFHLVELLLGIAATSISLWIIFLRPAMNRLLGLPSLALLSVAVLTVVVDVPGIIQDSGHFEFVAEELSSVAAGKVPGIDFYAQYSNVLPWLVSLPINALPMQSALTLLAVIALLQLLVIVIIVLIAWQTPAGARKPTTFLTVALLVAVGPLIANMGAETIQTETGRSFLTPDSYFQVFPVRVFLPVLTVYTAWRAAAFPDKTKFLKIPIFGLTALVAFIGMANDPAFGVPAAAVIWGTFLSLALTKTIRWANLWTFTGSLFVILALSLTTILLIDGGGLEKWWFWVDLFGAKGYLSVSSAMFGAHIAYIVIFFAQIAVGAHMVQRRPGEQIAGYTAQAVALMMAGGMGLVSVSYYLGRSLPPTAISGSAVFLALSAVVSLSYLYSIFDSKRSTPWTRPNVFANRSMVFFHTAVVAIALAFLAQGLPRQLVLVQLKIHSIVDYQNRTSTGHLAEDWPGEDFSTSYIRWTRLDQELELAREFNSAVSNLDLNDIVEKVQILPMSHLVQLETGISSASVASHPSYFNLSTVLRGAQCKELLERTRSAPIVAVLMRDSTAVALRKDPGCDRLLARGQVLNSAPSGKADEPAGRPTGIMLLFAEQRHLLEKPRG